MNRLKKFYYQECPICMEYISLRNDFYLTTCCSKLMHLSCIQQWNQRNKFNNNCILCRQKKKRNRTNRKCCIPY